MAKKPGDQAKRTIMAHRFADCTTVIIPNVGVVLCLKTEAEPEAFGGAGPALSVLFPIADARKVAAALAISAEEAALGKGPLRDKAN